MNPEEILAGTASLFLALGDKTRLRLLNLMRDREICVSNFTGTLGHSQPLISRHLAYLRNSGIVEARRDGKWMHYTISSRLDQNTHRLLTELFKWMEDQDGLRIDRDRYRETYSPDEVAAEPKPSRTKRSPRKQSAGRAIQVEEPRFVPTSEPEQYEFDEMELIDIEQPYEEDDYRDVRHNELEDFLL